MASGSVLDSEDKTPAWVWTLFDAVEGDRTAMDEVDTHAFRATVWTYLRAQATMYPDLAVHNERRVVAWLRQIQNKKQELGWDD